MRTMQELENDMTRNLIADKARVCALAIEAGNASDANAFAQATVRAARQLTAEAVEAELQAEPILRLVGSDYVAEIAQAYNDDAPLQADMVGELAAPVIVIEKSARGYKFTLPEWCAPSPNAVKGFKVPYFGISYHEATPNRPAYRLFPAEKLDDVIGLIEYWYCEPDPLAQPYNRNGGKICTVRVKTKAI